MTGKGLPLAGLRVLDYGQYVAAPFATMLLSDLGADVVKVEPPTGDEWRRYDPFEPGESRYFYALNRGKRSVALDLKTPEGRERSRELIGSADALVHNCLPERARRFGLDRDSVHDVNPRCVTVCVSAFGSDGPDSARPAYDLIGQALSGLLLADPRPGDSVPRRTGGLALADFTAGLLAALSVTSGLLGRGEEAPELEVSLLGAALALQAQRFVSVEGIDREARDGRGHGAAEGGWPGSGGPARIEGGRAAGRVALEEVAARVEALEALDPYYRAHACADGFVALACLNTAQRLRVSELFGLEDPFAGNPQAAPADADEHRRRSAHVRALEDAFARLSVREAVDLLGARGVPAGEVRSLDQLFDDDQVRANGLVQTVDQPGVGPVRLLGSPFKVDGRPSGRGRAAPALDEHAGELLGEPQRR
jgi:crotonobetainyl-CoA:carnitine CoA-transferase CaiB-like acyl-CoA transferase